MSSGLQKVVHIEVFDFEEDPFAYAIESHKNQFGYKYSVEYQSCGITVKEKPIVNNVERGAKFYRKLGINLSQLRSLKRRVRHVLGDKSFPFITKDGINVVTRGGNDVTYHGEHTEDFCQKVLKYKK